jgi:hypothetical protein
MRAPPAMAPANRAAFQPKTSRLATAVFSCAGTPSIAYWFHRGQVMFMSAARTQKMTAATLMSPIRGITAMNGSDRASTITTERTSPNFRASSGAPRTAMPIASWETPETNPTVWMSAPRPFFRYSDRNGMMSPAPAEMVTCGTMSRHTCGHEEK